MIYRYIKKECGCVQLKIICKYLLNLALLRKIDLNFRMFNILEKYFLLITWSKCNSETEQ